MGGIEEPSLMTAITVGKGGIYLNVHAQPGARRPAVRGMHGDAVKIAVREAAQDGKANAAIIHFLANALDCARKDIEVTSGHASRRKRLFISGDAQLTINCLRKMLEHA